MRSKMSGERRDHTLRGRRAPRVSTVFADRGSRILARRAPNGVHMARRTTTTHTPLLEPPVTPLVAPAPVHASRAPSGAFACVWIADPPSWALERTDSSLEGHAVIAVDGALVVGSNALARRAGVRPGEAVGRARGLCPDGMFGSLEPGMLEGAYGALLERLNTVCAQLERDGIATIYGGDLRAEDAARVALELGVRVGISASRGSALLAALAAREGTVRLESNEDAFLEMLPLRFLRGAGVSPDALERLALFGIASLGDLRDRITKTQLERQFPKDHARLLSLATGGDVRAVPVYVPPAGVTVRLELDDPALEPGELHPALVQLVADGISRLGRQLAGALSLEVDTPQGKRSSRIHLKDFTRDPQTLERAVYRALVNAQDGLEVTALVLTLTDLTRPMPVQESLFAMLERPGVREAVQRVHRRFPERLGRLRITNPRAYLPERRFRFVPLTGEERAKRGKR
jgi:nucleotidyltransferase/DNA polymerase involved in DNA repair